MIIATTEEHKMVKRKTDIKIAKIEEEADVLIKKKQITKWLQKKMRKKNKDKEYPTSAESRIQHSDEKNKHKFEQFSCPSKQQKNKTTFDMVVIEPVRNEETEKLYLIHKRQMEINNQMAKMQIIFYFTGKVQLAPIKQTGNNSLQSHEFI